MAVTPQPAVEPAPAQPRADSGARQLQALGVGRYADAVRIADDALVAAPDAELGACKNKAEAAVRAESAYQEGKQALAEGKLEDAYFLFAGIPDDSPFRTRPDVIDATRKVAQGGCSLRATLKSIRPRPSAWPARCWTCGLAPVVTRRPSAWSRWPPRRAPRPAPHRPPPGGLKAPPNPKARRAREGVHGCLARGDQRCVVKILEATPTGPRARC